MHKLGSLLLFDILLASLCALGAYRIALTADFPVGVQERAGSLFVSSSFSHTNPNTGLLSDDRIKRVDGKELASEDDLELACTVHPIGESIRVEVVRGSGMMMRQVVLTPRYSTGYLWIAIVTALTFFLMGIFAVYRRREDKAAQALHVLGGSSAALILLTTGRLTIDPQGLGYLLEILFQTAYVAVPVAFLSFTLRFPIARGSSDRHPIRWLVPLALVLNIWAAIAFLRAVVPNLDTNRFLSYHLAFNSLRVFFLLVIFFGVGVLVASYRRATEGLERRKLLWVLFGISIGITSFVVLWLVPQIVLGRGLVAEEWTLALLIVAPITFSIALVRYRLFDIHLLINRSSAYAIVIGTICILYLGVVVLVSFLASPFSLPTVVPNIVGALAIALLFEPLRRVVQRMVDRTFFRVEYDLKETERLSVEETKLATSKSELATGVVGRLTEALKVTRVGFFTLEVGREALHLEAHRGFELLERRGVKLQMGSLKSTLRLPVGLVDQIEPGALFEPADREVFDRWKIALVLPMLSVSGVILGFLAIGEKTSGDPFTMEDLQLLTSVSTVCAIGLERIGLQRRLLMEQEESERLKELNRLKSYFVSSVSHDLKTPLASIRIFAELLRNEALSSSTRDEYLTIVESETERLSRLISNVLDFAMIERGTKTYRPKPCELNEIVLRVLETMRYQLESQGFSVTRTLSEVPLFLQADQDALHDAITNLLSNAMKYSPVDRKSIEIATRLQDQMANISVRDRGIGIAQEERARIFEAFYRVLGDASNASGGAGLGLSLVRHVAEAHLGEIAVESTPGVGSTFSLSIPLRPQ